MIAESIRPEAFVDFVRQELDTIDRHVRHAVQSGEKRAVHKARVASRRLGTALEIVRPALSWHEIKPVAKLAKKIRRRLGKLRDLQVMRQSSRLRRNRGTGLLIKAIEDRLESLRAKNGRKLSAAAISRSLRRTSALKKALRHSLPTIETLVRKAMWERLREFERGARGFNVGRGKNRDVHRLRVTAKRLRYTLEVAAAMGVVLKTDAGRFLKRSAEHLGAWHDAAVMAAFVAARIVEDQTLEREPAVAAEYLALASAISADSLEALRRFQATYRLGQRMLVRTIGALANRAE
jgi:CHAD domain-containing protein